MSVFHLSLIKRHGSYRFMGFLIFIMLSEKPLYLLYQLTCINISVQKVNKLLMLIAHTEGYVEFHVEFANEVYLGLFHS